METIKVPHISLINPSKVPKQIISEIQRNAVLDTKNI